MEFLSKDKLAALEEERQQRRKARAEAAQQRLAEVGKQTQQMVQDHVSPNNADGPEQKQLRVGGLSRVLYEQARDPDGRRGARKNRGMDQLAARTAGFDALRSIDDAMRHINGAAQDATGAAMRGGLEDAAKSVNDAVSRVSAAINIGQGGRQQSAATNPLAEIMQQEAADKHEDAKADQQAEGAQHHDPQALQHEMVESMRANVGAKLDVPGANLLGANIGRADVNFGAAFGLGHEASHVIQQRGALPKLGEEIKDAGEQLGGELAGAAKQTPGKLLSTAESAIADVTLRAGNAPRELHPAAANANAKADDKPTEHKRDMHDRAADATRIISEDLKGVPKSVVENTVQVAAHVALGQESAKHALKDVVLDTAKDTGKDIAKDVALNEFKHTELGAKIEGSIGGAASNVKGALDNAREN
ncbi:MAG TPA: hypothetical protein VGC41_02740, partial [Kofleriaceae bacterium]